MCTVSVSPKAGSASGTAEGAAAASGRPYGSANRVRAAANTPSRPASSSGSAANSRSEVAARSPIIDFTAGHACAVRAGSRTRTGTRRPRSSVRVPPSNMLLANSQARSRRGHRSA